MNGRDTFFEVISPKHLYAFALGFVTLTVLVVIAIYIFLYVKKRRFRAKSRIDAILNDWIGELVTSENPEEIKNPEGLDKYLKKGLLRQFIIDKLIIVKKNIKGKAQDNIEELFISTGLVKDSVGKIKSPIWHIKANGIYELYMMEQHSMSERIMKYTNHSNKFIRREAQVATISFNGFAGLSFLDKLTQPIYEWQQLKLLQELNSMNADDMPHLKNWLCSDNWYVVQFALKLTYVYQQFDVHDDVANCLTTSKREKLRFYAIRALGRIANDTTAAILKDQYPLETTANKKKILTQLGRIGTVEEFDFLRHAFNEQDSLLKIEAARAIVSIDDSGWDVLRSYAVEDATMSAIYDQVKKEFE